MLFVVSTIVCTFVCLLFVVYITKLTQFLTTIKTTCLVFVLFVVVSVFCNFMYFIYFNCLFVKHGTGRVMLKAALLERAAIDRSLVAFGGSGASRDAKLPSAWPQ